jgi:urease beta subunit
MRRLILLFLALLAAAPAAAQRPEPDWRQAVEEQVLVRLSAYEPNEIRLEAGRPTRLVFFNNTRARLSLQAGSFFANSYIRRGDERLVSGGGITLEPGETRAVTLVPTPGRYRVRSRSWFRRLIGMSAVIVVEPAGSRQNARGRIGN